MREVLFRGKSVDNDEWVEGCLLDAKEDTYIIPHGYEYLYDELEKLAFNVTRHIVIPETVGQFTGLTDKNGRKIFEGDILGAYLDDEFPDDYTMVKVIWHNNGWYTQQNKALPDMLEYADSQRFEVISNIHDNPELLKGEGI